MAGGWGTPAPQQHMLAASRFASMQRAGASDDAGDRAEPSPSPSAAPAAKRARLDAPAFKAAAPQPVVSAPQSVSLELNSDDEDDDFE